jgi:PAS domain S-box-containing protein
VRGEAHGSGDPQARIRALEARVRELEAERGSQERFGELADTAPAILWVTDTDNRCTFISRGWYDYTGQGDGEGLGFGWTEAVHPDDRDAAARRFLDASRERRAFTLDFRLRRADGEYRRILDQGRPRFGEDGEWQGYVGSVSDVHDWLLAAEALRESESKYRALFNSTDEGFSVIQVLFDDADRPVDYRFLEANPSFEKHTGLHGAVGKTARELLPELEEHWFQVYGRVASTGEPVRFESGSDVMGRWFEVAAFRVQEPEERRVALLFTDVTERRRAFQERERLLEAALRSQERYELVNRATNDVIWDWDLATDELRWNEAIGTAFGYAPGDVPPTVGFWYDHIHPDDRERVTGGIHAVIDDGGTAWSDEYRFRRADGGYATVLDRGVLARDETGRATRMIGSMLDLTERERLLASERDARAEAEAANRAKADFLASMSHELRTPLNAIGGYVDLLDLGIHGPLTEAQREALARVTANQRHLLTLINDVLAFAKLEAGQVELDLRPLAACDLLSEVEPLVAPLAQARGIALSVQECDRALRVLGDAERVRQVLLNLVGNAIKFTPEGGWILLGCERGGEWVDVRVRDSGPGISAEKQQRIFDPFVQVDRRLSSPQEGVGLGLAISRDLAVAMGGELTVESAPGEGSTFTLRLPGVAGDGD